MTTETRNPNNPSGAGPMSEAGRTAEDEARNLRSDAVHEARKLKDQASEEVRARADDAKDTMAEEVSSVGKAFRTASGELREGSPQEQLFSTMAEGLADFADSVRGRSVSDLVHEVSDFGRRNPAAFLGGAALLGFAAVRAARASGRDRTPVSGTAGSVSRASAAEPAATRPSAASAPSSTARVHRAEDI